ncbi:alpha/beta hydrolase-fold protein [Planococcus shenhongbingii]|uniref:Alpha/beta hydrolase-fold protein n=1 Tax=Planococcus shenhongbingii TaxID=3058398 RepID=A0ABT8N921_9BACL|nr:MULTISPECIES: alpha/beta hydrolase-fold protein [unclassified Planococcus (in: firmicutes)]MDN7244380.1 alpha/beta hydrolase-fold protein [Planococcus sp. N017]WKA57546.1 alpha/beta hydrolase-fold protein [Planococcus sp. N016]
MNRGTVQDLSIYSKELQEDMQLLIYLPANFSPLYKYTLIIASDGKDYFQLGRAPRIADELLDNNEIENIIFVGVPYKSVKDRSSKYEPAGEKHGAYLRFLAHELVPYLDENYPTYQVGMGRALIGDSLAATVSLSAALKYPNIFGRVILQSPKVSDELMETVEAFNPANAFTVYHVIGKGETAVKLMSGETADFLEPNRKLNNLLKNKGFSIFYEEFEGDHTWKHWQPDLKRALLQNFGL